MNSHKQRLCSKYRKRLKRHQTPSEVLFEKFLNEKGIRYVPQKGWLKDGFYISDFYLPDHKTVIEIDGEYHKTIKQQIRDNDKDAYYSKRGFKVLRFTNVEVLNKQVLMEAIKTLYKPGSEYPCPATLEGSTKPVVHP